MDIFDFSQKNSTNTFSDHQGILLGGFCFNNEETILRCTCDENEMIALHIFTGSSCMVWKKYANEKLESFLPSFSFGLFPCFNRDTSGGIPWESVPSPA